MKDSGNFTDAEKLFERRKYFEAKEILLKQKTPEAIFYLALMAEKGLGEEINKDLAKDLYEKAFDSGINKAGLYLARMYQKEGSEKDATKIYKEIEEKGTDDFSLIAYAKYRLARIDANNSSKPLTERRKRAINERYTDAISIYNKLAPGSRAHAKAIYNQALFKLKLAENDRNILTEAKNLFKQAADMDYNPAKAEVLNDTTARLISRYNQDNSLGEELNEAVANCEHALNLDPKNISAKLLKSKALTKKAQYTSWHTGFEESLEVYDQARSALQEISTSDIEIENQQKELDSRLAEQIANKCNDYLTEYFDQFNTYQIYQDSDKTERIRQYVFSLSQTIESVLKNNPEFLSQASFKESSKIAHELSENLFHKNKDSIKKIIDIKTGTKLSKDKIKQSAVETIEDWTNLKKVDAIKKLGDITIEDRDLLIKRQDFQEKVESNLYDLYIKLLDATSDKPTVTIKIEDSWFEQGANVAQNILPTLAGFMGPMLGGHWIGLASTAAKLGKEKIHELRQNAVNEAARKFCKIGNRDPKEAKKYFEAVSHELVNIYGMQIDNIDPKAIDILAKAAVDKMVAHVTTETAFFKKITSVSLSKTITTMSRAAINAVIAGVSNEEEKDIPPVELLLTGIVEGKSLNKDIKIKTISTNDLNEDCRADGIFERTAITNGRENYEHKGFSNPSKYGYRYTHNIPLEYDEVQKTVGAAKLARDLERHTKLIKLANKKLPENKSYRLVKEKAIDEVSLRKEERELNREKYGAILLAIAGATVISLAIIASVGIGIGLLPLPFIVEAVVGMIAGSFICTQGAVNLNRISGLIEKLPARHTYEVEKEVKPEISKEQLKAQHKSFVEKLDDKAKPSYKFNNNLSHREKLQTTSSKSTETKAKSYAERARLKKSSSRDRPISRMSTK